MRYTEKIANIYQFEFPTLSQPMKESKIVDTEKVLPKIIENENIKPNVVFVDPPRKGLDNKTIGALKELKPEKIVYISCNPATLVRDLAKIEEKYHIEKIQPVDMFPFTSHVECVVVLQQKIDK